VRSYRPAPPPPRPFRLQPPTPGRSIGPARPVDHVLETMRKYGARIDRESYIHFAYGEIEDRTMRTMRKWGFTGPMEFGCTRERNTRHPWRPREPRSFNKIQPAQELTDGGRLQSG